MISSEKRLAQIKEELRCFEESIKKYSLNHSSFNLGLAEKELEKFSRTIQNHEKNLKDIDYDKNILRGEIEKTEKDWICYQEKWNSFYPDWLYFVLNELKKEIIGYEKTLDEDKSQNHLDRQQYYRVIDLLNFFLAKDRVCQKDINNLQKLWKSEVEKDFHKIPVSILGRDRWFKNKRAEMKNDREEKKSAFFQDVFAIITIIIGAYLGLATKNPIVFMLVFFASAVLMSECAKTQNRNFINRDRNSYLFTPMIWSIIFGVATLITSFFLSGVFTLIFIGTMTYLCLQIGRYEKQLPKKGP